ncbi:MAG: hypothetical protein WCT50_03390 [Patescibacteria group bacterium]
MTKELDKNKEIDDIYQKAREEVADLGFRQREIAISYLKKIEQKKINDLRELLSKS